MDYFSPEFLYLCFTFLVALISTIITIVNIIRGKKADGSFMQIIRILPDAMQAAEDRGGSSQEKLTECISYIQERLPKLKLSTIVDCIEKGIEISKTINNKSSSSSQSNKSTSESRRSIWKNRNLLKR